MYVTNDREMDKEGNNYVIGAFCAGLSLPPICSGWICQCSDYLMGSQLI